MSDPMPISYPAIQFLVPHQSPMILIDRVVSANLEELVAEVCIHPQSLFFDGYGVGAWVGIEYMAQAIAAHAGYQAQAKGLPIKVGFLLGTRRFESAKPRFMQGEVLHIHVRCALQSENGLGAFECSIYNALQPAVSLVNATITVFQPENVDDFLQGMLK